MKDVIIALVLAAILGTGGFFATEYIMHSRDNAEIARQEKPKTRNQAKDLMESERINGLYMTYSNHRLVYASIAAGIGALVGVGLSIVVTGKKKKQ